MLSSYSSVAREAYTSCDGTTSLVISTGNGVSVLYISRIAEGEEMV